MSLRIICLAAVVSSIACTPPSTTTGSHNSSVITKEEIAAAHVSNAFDAITLLRPTFLRYRGVTSLQPDTSCRVVGNTGSCSTPVPGLEHDTGYPRVYLNHQFYGDIPSLRGIDAGSIVEIHYYNPQQASNRFGLGNQNGAIEVITGTGQ